MTVETVQSDIAAFLTDQITLNELIMRNDRVIDQLFDEHKGGPVWRISAKLEGLICEHVYQYVDEPTFRAALGGLL